MHVFHATTFIRECKQLVQDLKLTNIMFASSDQLIYEHERQRECRLDLIHLHELSIPLAKRYLEEQCGLTNWRTRTDRVNAWLESFPRTFKLLDDFGRVKDHNQFVEDEQKLQTNLIKLSIKNFPEQRWWHWMKRIMFGTDGGKGGSENPIALYQLVLKQEVIDIDDIVDIGGMSQETFVKEFVVTNIFRPLSTGEYRLQYDSTKIAVEKVVCKANECNEC